MRISNPLHHLLLIAFALSCLFALASLSPARAQATTADSVDTADTIAPPADSTRKAEQPLLDQPPLSFDPGDRFVLEVPTEQPRTFQDPETGKLFWNRKLPVYVGLSVNPDGSNPNVLGQPGKPPYSNPMYFDTEGVNYIRHRWAVSPQTSQTVKPPREVQFEVYADGMPPVSRLDLSRSVKADNGLPLIGGDDAVRIVTKDEVSGVGNVYYSLNGQEYQGYYGPFKPNGGDGRYNIQFLAFDRVGNGEKPKEASFMLDTQGPTSILEVEGPQIERTATLGKGAFFRMSATDALAGVETIEYRLDGGEWRKYSPGGSLTLGTVKDGPHTLEYRGVDRVGNREETKVHEFFLDITAPITISDILGDRFMVDGKLYFSGRTKMKITAVDNRAGVQEVMYSIDDEPFKPYNEPFYMPVAPGMHSVKYYSVDSLQNRTLGLDYHNYLEQIHTVDRIIVDLTGPSLEYAITGTQFARRDTVYLAPSARISLKGHDTESGLKQLAYAMDGEAWEKSYEGPFDLEGVASGVHSLEVIGYDNVNNRNVRTFTFVLDSDPPSVTYSMSVAATDTIGVQDPSRWLYPVDAKIYLTAQDAMTGIKRLEYSLNGKAMRAYQGSFGGLELGRNRLRVRVEDMVGNVHEKIWFINAR